MKTKLLFLFAFAMVQNLAQAQNPKPELSQWKPSQLPPAEFEFKNVVVAKTSADNLAIMLLIPQFTRETRTRSVPVTTMTTETRQRTITKDGRQLTQDYTVQVPVTTMQEQTYTVNVMAPAERVTFPFDKIRAWHLDGKAIDRTEMITLFSKPTHAFASPMAPERIPQIDPYFASVLRPDTVILGIAPEALTSALDQGKANDDKLRP